jgi:hypothetical protein
MTGPPHTPSDKPQPVGEPTELEQEGPFAHENWRRALAGAAAMDSYEYPLFSDAHVSGELLHGLGPYQVLNCISDPVAEPRKPVLMLRATNHVSAEPTPMVATDTSRYHGGTDSDEMAALLSLLVGVRLKAGSPSRWFKVGDDPRGRPWSFRLGPTPSHA